MLSGPDQKTGLSVAEHAREKSPDGMRWDQDLVRDGVCSYVVAACGDPGGVLTGDCTGFDNTSRAGRITN